ncbi:Hypothetical protein I596_1017 [Dokdonella koreensis DS-123]|uniref:Uncharacterized protein n=1 Tax=Dokdonella koreensis DS-123 TaxID=1300342 RepID=A0A160DS23_9GAMM|nr:Hypothetical protein I596_1017 [Dokdonella koreensis DS-123]
MRGARTGTARGRQLQPVRLPTASEDERSQAGIRACERCGTHRPIAFPRPKAQWHFDRP